MKAVVFHAVGDIRVDDVPEPTIQEPTGAVRPSEVLTQVDDLTGAIEAYEAFDQRQDGWHKVALDPAGV